MTIKRLENYLIHTFIKKIILFFYKYYFSVMPNCIYCSKVFKDSQALGNHIRTHLDDSDEDLLSPNQSFHDTTIQILHNQNISIETNVALCVEQKLNNSQQEETTFNNVDEVIDDINTYFSIESQSENDDNEVANLSDDESIVESSDEESMVVSSDEESVASGLSDLSYITNVDANEYIEYDALSSGIPSDPEDIRQEFPSEEYAEFMHMITQFRVQDSLANAFIK